MSGVLYILSICGRISVYNISSPLMNTLDLGTVEMSDRECDSIGFCVHLNMTRLAIEIRRLYAFLSGKDGKSSANI